ncbi:MAG: TonB-dependent receptor, partial [Parvibaculales bacterium]
YMQKDAEFHGYEFEIGQRVNLWQGLLWLSVGRDTVSGKFADGTYVPRIPPSRNIYSAVYAQNDWEVSAILKNVAAQSQLSTNETATDGYEMLDINFTQTFQLRSGVNLELSIFGNNLLDEVARNHTSPVKNEVPLAGKNYGIGLQMKF